MRQMRFAAAFFSENHCAVKSVRERIYQGDRRRIFAGNKKSLRSVKERTGKSKAV